VKWIRRRIRIDAAAQINSGGLMGSHRRTIKKVSQKKESKKIFQMPLLPNNIGRKTSWKNISGERRNITIIDEIKRIQSNNKNKLIVFQKLLREHNKAIEYRLGYYMIGVKPRMVGKWIWGQFATIIPAVDLRGILRTANKKGWL
jgi:hypothetical protein